MKLRSAIQFCLATFILISSPLPALAETVWLSDELWVNVRTGPSSEFRSLKTINSGTRMDVLEEDVEAGYIRVRTENGLEGWLPARYTQDEPTGSIQAENLTAEKEQLQQQLDALDKKYNDLLAGKGDVNGELDSLRTSNEELTKELNRVKAISENAISLDDQYQELAEEHARVKNELDVLKAENAGLRERNDNKMLYAGGFMVFIGIVLGVILPRLTSNRRRKDGWA